MGNTTPNISSFKSVCMDVTIIGFWIILTECLLKLAEPKYKGPRQTDKILERIKKGLPCSQECLETYIRFKKRYRDVYKNGISLEKDVTKETYLEIKSSLESIQNFQDIKVDDIAKIIDSYSNINIDMTVDYIEYNSKLKNSLREARCNKYYWRDPNVIIFDSTTNGFIKVLYLTRNIFSPQYVDTVNIFLSGPDNFFYHAYVEYKKNLIILRYHSSSDYIYIDVLLSEVTYSFRQIRNANEHKSWGGFLGIKRMVVCYDTHKILYNFGHHIYSIDFDDLDKEKIKHKYEYDLRNISPKYSKILDFKVIRLIEVRKNTLYFSISNGAYSALFMFDTNNRKFHIIHKESMHDIRSPRNSHTIPSNAMCKSILISKINYYVDWHNDTKTKIYNDCINTHDNLKGYKQVSNVNNKHFIKNYSPFIYKDMVIKGKDTDIAVEFYESGNGPSSCYYARFIKHSLPASLK